MAIDLYQPFTNPITRETFRCISFTEEAYTMEWTVHPGGYVPFEHVHMKQDEIFHIQRGGMRARMQDTEVFGKVGETVKVPCGTRHIAFNDRAEPLVCVVEYRPGLDHYQSMQCFAGLTLDGSFDKKGLVDIPRIMYLLKRGKFSSLTRPSFAPEWLFHLGMSMFYWYGYLSGWEALYKKYTN